MRSSSQQIIRLALSALALAACSSGAGDASDEAMSGTPSGGGGSVISSNGGFSPAAGGAGVGGLPLQGGTGGAANSGGSGSSSGGTSTGGALSVGGGESLGVGSSAGEGAGGDGIGGSDDLRLSIVGRQLFLHGEPFYIRGVNWNPVPKGATHPEGLDYSGFADQDIALMAAAGINAVRTYERLEDVIVLDKLLYAGIYVFSTVYGWHGDDPGVVTERVNAAKDHPAILAWVIGNEWNYNQLYADDGDTPGARNKLNQAAAAIKAADPSRPVATIWGGTSGLAETVALMPDIELWGINFYGGLSLADPLNAWPNSGDGPMFFGEYGADAYNDNTDLVDTEAQAVATRTLTQAIIDDYATASGGVTVGGFVFEWSDEWWKDGSGSPNVQDVGGIAPGGGPHPDETFNEEFWGLVDIDRNPRPAYEELKALYTE